MGIVLSRTGTFVGAVEQGEKAEAIWRDLGARQRVAYRTDWAVSLGNVAEARNSAGRSQDAVAAAEQAISLLHVRATNYANRPQLGFDKRVLAESMLGAGPGHEDAG